MERAGNIVTVGRVGITTCQVPAAVASVKGILELVWSKAFLMPGIIWHRLESRHLLLHFHEHVCLTSTV